VVPDSAEALGPLEDLKRLDARAAQGDPHADPAEAGADDRDGELSVGRRGAHGAAAYRPITTLRAR
jgi:hypothetical protein